MKIPAPLKLLYDWWMKLSRAIGLVVSSVLLTVLWGIGFGAYAIAFKVMRLFTKKTQIQSTWVTPPEEESELSNQF